jgi:hypothetical protein
VNLRKDHSCQIKGAQVAPVHNTLLWTGGVCLTSIPPISHAHLGYCLHTFTVENTQLVALDPLARHSMKTVANCDKWCDMRVQNLYVNHRIVERIASSFAQARYAPLSVIMSLERINLFSRFGIHGRLGHASLDEFVLQTSHSLS